MIRIAPEHAGPSVADLVDSIEDRVVASFDSWSVDVEAKVAEALREAVDGFDFKAQVRKVDSKVIRERIDAAVRAAFRDASWDRKVRTRIARTIREASLS